MTAQEEKRKRNKLSRCQKTGLLAFLLPTAVMLTLFVCDSIFPFGDRSFLSADLYHQYMPFFRELVHKVRAGESLSFSYNVGIGSNFLALFGYYLASPFYLFGLLVPEEYLIEFLSYLVVLKVGLCGLTCFFYFKNHFRTENTGILLFSCFYAMSGFMAAYNYNVMWLDCVVLLPLIVLGLEQLVKEGRCGLYCVTLGLSIFTNFYLSIMICIFLILYFLVLLVSEKHWLRSIGCFVLFSLLAGGMAAVLLYPEVRALLETDFGDMDFPKTLESYFPVLDMLARHCVCVFTERGLDHWPNIYCGSAVLMLIPMYLMNREISVREKFCRMALCGFLLLSFGTNILDFIWHGLNYPDSLPARQSFIYILLVLTMCCEAFLRAKETDRQQIVYGFLAAVVFLLFCEKFVEHEDFETGVKLLTLVFVSGYAVLLWLYRTREDGTTVKAVAAVALFAVVLECGVNTWDTSIATVSRSDYLAKQEDYKALYAMTQQREESLYRVELFDRRTKNDGTLAGLPTASVFSSTLNSYVMDMYRLLGMQHSKVFYGFDGATALTSAMLNVNYMFAGSDKYENGLYTLLAKSGEVCLYESNATLPFGYVAPVGFDLSETITNNGIRLQEQMISDLGISGRLFKSVRAEKSGNDVVYTPEKGGYYYAFLDRGGTGRINYIGGSTEEEKFYDLQQGAILYLGYLEKGQTVTLTNGDEEDATPEISAKIYQMNAEILREALELLSARHMENVEWSSDRIEGDLNLTEPGRLILSVPYEAGWRILINGEESEGTLFGGCLMAFDLEPGQYHFELKYVPAGAGTGILISALSIALFAVVMLRGRKRGKREDDQNPVDEMPV